MKRFETPVMNIEKFELSNIITASGETPADAVEAAMTDLKNKMGITEDKTFVITL